MPAGSGAAFSGLTTGGQPFTVRLLLPRLPEGVLVGSGRAGPNVLAGSTYDASHLDRQVRWRVGKPGLLHSLQIIPSTCPRELRGCEDGSRSSPSVQPWIPDSTHCQNSLASPTGFRRLPLAPRVQTSNRLHYELQHRALDEARRMSVEPCLGSAGPKARPVVWRKGKFSHRAITRIQHASRPGFSESTRSASTKWISPSAPSRSGSCETRIRGGPNPFVAGPSRGKPGGSRRMPCRFGVVYISGVPYPYHDTILPDRRAARQRRLTTAAPTPALQPSPTLPWTRPTQTRTAGIGPFSHSPTSTALLSTLD